MDSEPYAVVTHSFTRLPWREAKAALFEYIEIYYNRKRRHSGIGYRTPAQANAEMLIKAAA